MPVKFIKNSYLFYKIKQLFIRFLYRGKKNKSINEIFTEIFKRNEWNSSESISGIGSQIDQTEAIRNALPDLIKKFKVKIFLDVPCGDFNWMKLVNLNVEKYIGGDIVDEIISNNNKLYVGNNKQFEVIDLTKEMLPESDILFCRDCLVHLSYNDIKKTISNIKKSKIKYLLTTNFTDTKRNIDIPTGAWRPINLQKKPFYFPKPILVIYEQYLQKNGKHSDKCVALWEIKELPN